MRRLLLCAFMILAASLARAAEPHKTDWFAASKYGVMVHYLECLQNDAMQVQSLGRKPAFLMNRDGTAPLTPSCGNTHQAAYGVDGNPGTMAIAANGWAWSYDVSLLNIEKVSRIVVDFGQGYATEFEILASTDAKTWQKLAAYQNQNGGRVEAQFPTIDARIIRVRALKPDDANQPGGQMSIAELEVYE